MQPAETPTTQRRLLRELKRGAALVILATLFLMISCAGTSNRDTSTGAAGRYSNRLHNRFYEGWTQPKSVSVSTGKISVPVEVRIDKKGRVVGFTVERPSGNRAIDDSIEAAVRGVKKVAAPPFVASDGTFHLRVFFELDIRRNADARRSTALPSSATALLAWCLNSGASTS
ncbi:hypothetical protein BH18VER1_BH18VER1_03620 [soil metagenome]